MSVGIDEVKPTVSVIVPVFQQWELVESLLSAMSVQTMSPSQWELIIVDNGSDKVPSLPEVDFSTQVIVCTTPGSYAARNEGVKYAKGTYLIFTDADCIPQPRWLEEMVRCLSVSERVVAAGAVEVKALHHRKKNIYEIYDSLFGLPQEKYVKSGYAVTANLGFHKSLYDLVGGFNGARFSGGDAEFCRAALKVGASLSYVGDAIVWHPARDNWRLFETKILRVKGGQLRHGSGVKKIVYFLYGIYVPFRQAGNVVLNKTLSFSEKVKLILLISKMLRVTFWGSLMIIMGGEVERR